MVPEQEVAQVAVAAQVQEMAQAVVLEQKAGPKLVAEQKQVTSIPLIQR